MGATPNPLHIDPTTGKVYRELGYTGVQGYRRVGDKLVHRLVWEHVHGPIPEGMVINHINGVKTDNRIENLECVTEGENHDHATYVLGVDRGAGVRHRGEAHHAAKVTEDDVRTMRRRAIEGQGLDEIAADYPVSRSTVVRILNRSLWAHVDPV